MNDEKSWWGKSSVKPRYLPSQVRHFSRKSIVVTSLFLIAAMVMFYMTIFRVHSLESSRGPWNSKAYVQSIDSMVSGCGKIYVFNPSPQNYGIYSPEDVTKNKLGKINVPSGPMYVPVFGWMTEDGIDKDTKQFAGKDVPNLSQILRSMYDGTTIIWYTTKTDSNTLKEITQYVNTHKKVAMIEWNATSLSLPGNITKDMPENRNIALSTWGVSQTCQDIDTKIINQFIDFNETHELESQKRSKVPPQAVLTPQGKLPNILVQY